MLGSYTAALGLGGEAPGYSIFARSVPGVGGQWGRSGEQDIHGACPPGASQSHKGGKPVNRG